jgi:hypothetical protein
MGVFTIRHSNNLHAGQAVIVRPYEYIIGRLNGNFHTPKDPLTYRRRKENGLFQQNINGNYNGFTSKVIADSTQQSPKANNVSAPFTFHVQSTPKIGDNRSLDYTEKILEAKLKLEEFNILANRYYHQDNARIISAIANTLLFNYGHEKFVDEKLEQLRKVDRMRSGSMQAISFNNVANYGMPYNLWHNNISEIY